MSRFVLFPPSPPTDEVGVNDGGGADTGGDIAVFCGEDGGGLT